MGVVAEDGGGAEEGLGVVAGVVGVAHGVVGAQVGGGAVGVDVEDKGAEGGEPGGGGVSQSIEGGSIICVDEGKGEAMVEDSHSDHGE